MYPDNNLASHLMYGCDYVCDTCVCDSANLLLRCTDVVNNKLMVTFLMWFVLCVCIV